MRKTVVTLALFVLAFQVYPCRVSAAGNAPSPVVVGRERSAETVVCSKKEAIMEIASVESRRHTMTQGEMRSAAKRIGALFHNGTCTVESLKYTPVSVLQRWVSTILDEEDAGIYALAAVEATTLGKDGQQKTIFLITAESVQPLPEQ